MSTIAVAMSGGVDSSVAAAMLIKQGHKVFGITMQLFPPHISESGSAARDAAIVAEHLGIPHRIVDFSSSFRRLIIDDFIEEYRTGRTPNPCVLCNRHIKFGLLLEKALQLGADFLATGHYARKTIDRNNDCHLRTAENVRKDQSYFLYALTRRQLQYILFPLGSIENKDEVRRLAHEMALPVAEKTDSQEVCFIPNDDYAAFLEGSSMFDVSGGDIVHMNGKTVGRHHGTHRYTIGQRKGLGVAWSEPLYVTAIDAARNIITVGEQGHLFATGLKAEAVSWLSPPDGHEFEATCKIRYRHQPVGCSVHLLAECRCEVHFHQPQKAVTPGQSLVIYRGDEVLGGGRIVAALHVHKP